MLPLASGYEENAFSFNFISCIMLVTTNASVSITCDANFINVLVLIWMQAALLQLIFRYHMLFLLSFFMSY